jgi:glycosyltransferase involved in cell wall biosynthesis
MPGRRVVMILSNGLASDPRVEKEAAALVGAGCEVTVLAWDRGGALPAREERDGLVIERFGPAAEHGGGLRNVGRYRTFWALAAARAAELAPDAVHCHDLDTAPAGMRVVREVALRPRLVLDFHELYRESNMVPQRGVVGLVARAAVRVVERRALAAADVVLVANPGTLDYYRGLGAGAKLVPIENAPDAGVFRPAEGPRPDRPFTIGFAGQKRYLGGLATLIEVVRRDEGLAAVLAGGGTRAEEVARMAAGLERIEVSGPFAYADLPAMYARCDAVYAVYDVSLGNVRTLFPVKVMEAMACALPVIVAEGTWVGEYVLSNGVGVAVTPDDGESLAQAIEALKRDPALTAEMGRRGRALVEAGLNWDAVSERLLGTYGRLFA